MHIKLRIYGNNELTINDLGGEEDLKRYCAPEFRATLMVEKLRIYGNNELTIKVARNSGAQ